MATKYDIPQVFTDYQAMLAVGDLQVVAILTPDDEGRARSDTLQSTGNQLPQLCRCDSERTDHCAQLQRTSVGSPLGVVRIGFGIPPCSAGIGSPLGKLHVLAIEYLKLC